MKELLARKIETRKAKIGVIGLGYVGLPLAMEFVQAGFEVIGIDINEETVRKINQGDSHIIDVPAVTVANAVGSNKFRATADFKEISELDAVSICVPTPLNKNQEPDVSYLNYTAEKLGRYMNNPLVISLESTTYPGSTRELFHQYFEGEQKVVDRDYFLCFSPERIDPGNPTFQTNNIPKVIGGITAESSNLGQLLYETIVTEVVQVSSPETAEMSKLLENTFRSINIAFMNELALMCERLEIDIWESVDAAATKPFGFLPFYPGAGVGGHCIPLDPMYLYWKGKQSKFFNKFIELSQAINMNMPFYVVEKISDALNSRGKSIRNARILLVGVSYKANINDVRESPTLDIYEQLKEKQAWVEALDPYVDSFKDQTGVMIPVIQEAQCDFALYDCVVILTKHSVIPYQTLLEDSQLVVDMCHTYETKHEKLIRLGGGPMQQMEIKEKELSGK